MDPRQVGWCGPESDWFSSPGGGREPIKLHLPTLLGLVPPDDSAVSAVQLGLRLDASDHNAVPDGDLHVLHLFLHCFRHGGLVFRLQRRLSASARRYSALAG